MTIKFTKNGTHFSVEVLRHNVYAPLWRTCSCRATQLFPYSYDIQLVALWPSI